MTDTNGNVDSSTLKPADFDVVMQRLMGEKKQRTQRYIETWNMVKASRPKEELMVHAAFESCAFKSALSCLAGKLELHDMLFSVTNTV